MNSSQNIKWYTNGCTAMYLLVSSRVPSSRGTRYPKSTKSVTNTSAKVTYFVTPSATKSKIASKKFGVFFFFEINEGIKKA